MARVEPTSFEAICDRLEVPEALRKHISPEAPSRGKMAVAKGLLPAPPKALLAMQYVLIGDGDEEVAQEAGRTLSEMPEDRLLGLIDRKTHPKIIEFVAYRRLNDRRLMERVALLHQANDKTICYLAEKGSERICEMVAGNQERLIITPQIYTFLQRNPNASAALCDRVKSFHRLYGIEMPDADELAVAAEAQRKEQEAIAEAARQAEAASQAAAAAAAPPTAPPSVSPPPPVVGGPPPDDVVGAPLWQATEPGELPADFVPGEVYIPAPPEEQYSAPAGLLNPLGALFADWGIPDHPDFVAPPEGLATGTGPAVAGEPAAPPLVVDTSALTGANAEELGSVSGAGAEDVDLSGMSSLAGSDFSFDFKEETTDFGSEFIDDDGADDDDVRESVAMAISKMTVGQKIKLAYKGNKAVRELLVRDSNKLVGVAVVKSGRITDQEVSTIATNRAINEEVIRALTENREYLRKYPIKVALVNNPKTPIPTAITMLNSLHVKDLKLVSTNRNISSAVFMAATKLYKARKSGRG